MKQLRYPGRQGIDTGKPPVKKRYFGSWKVAPWFWWAFALWIFPAMAWGIVSAQSLWHYDGVAGYYRSGARCLERPRRIEILFPFYIAGCYIGGELGEGWYFDASKETKE